MFTKILVPLDRSQVAEKAIAPALDLARRYKGTLFLLCTCTTELSREYLQDFSNDHNWFWSISSKDPVYLEGMDYLNKLSGMIQEAGGEGQVLQARSSDQNGVG